MDSLPHTRTVLILNLWFYMLLYIYYPLPIIGGCNVTFCLKLQWDTEWVLINKQISYGPWTIQRNMSESQYRCPVFTHGNKPFFLELYTPIKKTVSNNTWTTYVFSGERVFVIQLADFLSIAFSRNWMRKTESQI